MKINQDKCIGCLRCIPYCPIEANRKNVEASPACSINQQDCVECGACLRSGVCPTDAIYWRVIVVKRDKNGLLQVGAEVLGT